MVCFIVDVLPAVGTGLKDREGGQSRKVSPRRSQSRTQATPGGCVGGEGQKATLPPVPPELGTSCLGASATYMSELQEATRKREETNT